MGIVLDIQTEFVLFMLAALVPGLALVLAGRHSTLGGHSITLWGWSDLTLAVGLLCLALGTATSPVLSIVLGNALLVLSLALIHQALRVFGGGASQARVYLPAIVAALLLGLCLRLGATVALRSIIVDTLLAYLAMRSAVLAFTTGAAASAMSRGVTGGGLAVIALILVARVAATLLIRPTPQRLLVVNAVTGAGWALIFVATLCVTMGYLLMVNERLVAENFWLATTDSLTGIRNRRAIDALLEKELIRSRHHGVSLAVLLIDLDHFKRINDTYGHPAGDAVLQAFVHLACEHLQPPTFFGRYGGEEFLVVLPGTTAPQALRVAEDLRAVLGPAILEARHQLRVTISAGVAATAPGEYDHASLVRAADAALYAAKGRGRNQVISAETLEEMAREPGVGFYAS